MKPSQLTVLAILIVTTVALGVVGVFAFAFSSSPATIPDTSNTGVYGNYPNGMMGGSMGMMDGWMGGNNGASSSTQNPVPVQNPASTILGLVALGGSVIAGTGGLAYYVSIPKNKLTPSTIEDREEKLPRNTEDPYVSVSKTLTADERKVLDVIVSHDGKYLQKYIRAETGLSRLKTHRIVARLAERGVVTLEKVGNTNEIRLSTWLQQSNAPEPIRDQNVKKIRVPV